KIVNSIADDLKILASEAICTLNSQELASDKQISSKFNTYYLSFVKLVFSFFENQDEIKWKKRNVESILHFCFHLAEASLKRSDYFTSFALYMCLTNTAIECLYETAPRKRSISPGTLIGQKPSS